MGYVFKVMPELNSIKTPEKIEVISYNKDMVEHLTDQLVKLQRSYDLSNSTSARVELTTAMKTINKTLEMVLLPSIVIK
jgi:hypothetical protein